MPTCFVLLRGWSVLFTSSSSIISASRLKKSQIYLHFNLIAASLCNMESLKWQMNFTWSTGSSVAVFSSSCTTSAPCTSSRLLCALLNTLCWTVTKSKLSLIQTKIKIHSKYLKIFPGLLYQIRCLVAFLPVLCFCGPWPAWQRRQRPHLLLVWRLLCLVPVQLHLLSTSPCDHLTTMQTTQLCK